MLASLTDGIASILKEIPPTKENSEILALRYNKLRSINIPIMTSMANLILHLEGKEIPHADLSVLADRAEEEALILYKSTPVVIPLRIALANSALVGKEKLPPHASEGRWSAS